MNDLLAIRGLRTYFHTESGVAKAVDGVDLDIAQGEVLGLVGESGSGKSVTALSILRLIPDPPGRIVAGDILFKGRDLLKLSWDDIREIRGNAISMVFHIHWPPRSHEMPWAKVSDASRFRCIPARLSLFSGTGSKRIEKSANAGLQNTRTNPKTARMRRIQSS